jgi:hypothetical protein
LAKAFRAPKKRSDACDYFSMILRALGEMASFEFKSSAWHECAGIIEEYP